jgi:pilus assembly protein CpaF
MLQIEIQDPNGDTQHLQAPNECVIGKGPRCEVRLNSWRVAKEHARLFKSPSGVLLDDMGAFGGVTVNGQRVNAQYGPLRSTDVVGIGPYTLRVVEVGADGKVGPERPSPSRTPRSAKNASEPMTKRAGLKVVPASVPAPQEPVFAPVEPAFMSSAAVQADEPMAPEPSFSFFRSAVPAAAVAPPAPEPVAAPVFAPVPPPRAANVAVVAKALAPASVPKPAPAPHVAPVAQATAERHQPAAFEWRQRIHTALLETMDLRRQDVNSMSDVELREQTSALIRQILQNKDAEIPRDIDRDLLCKHVLNEAVGLGPLEELLADDSVSEIMVNRFDEIYVERNGRLQRYPLSFTGDLAVMGVIERIVAPLGRRIDEASPMVDARLKDGSRVNVIIPPLALKGPCLTIRKFPKRKLTAQDLVDFDAISPEMAEFLEVCMVARKNTIVSGGTGSGKTTLLNILSNFIPLGERIITVEDSAELKLGHEHLVSLESRPANAEGKGGVEIRDLVKNSLRMRPDRIVIGECRGAEAMDMLQAMNTGHEGSLTTLHANTPRDGLSRLETMVLMAGLDLPLVAIREQIASAVNIMVQQTRFACGSRKVTSITELTGIESGRIATQELFKFVSVGYAVEDGRPGKVQGYFTACNTVPTFYEELRATGTDLDIEIFKSSEQSADSEHGPS